MHSLIIVINQNYLRRVIFVDLGPCVAPNSLVCCILPPPPCSLFASCFRY